MAVGQGLQVGSDIAIDGTDLWPVKGFVRILTSFHDMGQ
jgi:hypothetical protein